MSKTASVLYEAGTAYPSRVSGFTPNFVGVHVHSQFCWGPCSLSVLLGSVFTLSFVGVRVHSQFCWGPCSLPVVLGSVFTPSFVGFRVHSQFCWGSCSLPVLLGSVFTPSFVGFRVHSQLCWGPCSLPVVLGSVFTPSFVGVRVHSHFCWGSCSLPVFVGVRVHSQFLLGSVLLIMLVFGVVFLRLFFFVLCLVYSMLPVYMYLTFRKCCPFHVKQLAATPIEQQFGVRNYRALCSFLVAIKTVTQYQILPTRSIVC
jgi:hypothetical protein